MKIGRVRTRNGEISLVTDRDGTLFEVQGDLLAGRLQVCDNRVEACEWLAPVEPRAILCIGRNYAAHAAEGGAPPPDYPVLFFKNPAAATGHGQPIVLPEVCEDEVDYEGELAVVLGRTTRDISPDQALSAVAGYTVANDVSARVWQQQKGGSQWNRGKSFDTFCPLGPWLVTADTGLDPTDLRVRTRLNGQLMQDGHTRDLLFPVAELIAFLSQGTTLLSGTVLLTGTPEGVGWARTPRVTLHAGDVVDVEIPGIGCLRSPVRSWR